MQPPNTPDVVVFRADDPRARGAVERILGASYPDLQPALRVFSLVVTRKAIHAIGGSVKALGAPHGFLPDGTPFGETPFYYSVGFPAGSYLVSPIATISERYVRDERSTETILGAYRTYKYYNRALRPGPCVDFIMFMDGTDWGTDKQQYRRQLDEAPGKVAEISAQIAGMSDAEANQFLAKLFPGLPNTLVQAAVGYATMQEERAEMRSAMLQMLEMGRRRSPQRSAQ